MSAPGYASLTIGTPPTAATQGFVLAQSTDVPAEAGVATLTINAALGLLLRPRGAIEQRLSVRLRAHLPDGVSETWQVISWAVTDSEDTGAVWTLVLPAETAAKPRGFFKWETDYQGAPPPGNGIVLFELIFDLPDGSMVPYPMWSGLTMESRRRAGSTSGHVLELSGMDGRAEVDRAVGQISFPPGHGKTQGQMTREILLAIGFPESRIKVGANLGTPRSNPFDLSCAEGWARAVEVMLTAGFVLKMDREDPPNAIVDQVQGGLFS